MPPFPQTEPEIRAAVLEWYSKESNFDKRPIKYMTMTAITPTPAYRYILETFVENRVIGTKSIPFRDQVVPPAKPCPDKWSIKVTPPPTPPGTEVVIDFRETSALQRCPTCGKIRRALEVWKLSVLENLAPLSRRHWKNHMRFLCRSRRPEVSKRICDLNSWNNP